MKYVLGIDFGGGASKATLLDGTGKIVAQSTVEYPTLYTGRNFSGGRHSISIGPHFAKRSNSLKRAGRILSYRYDGRD